jgi:hypothetical protein
MDILSVFCDIDDFCSRFAPVWRPHRVATAGQKRPRASRLALSEVLAILVLFPGLHYRTFQPFYLPHVCTPLGTDFPGLPSYSRFVALIPSPLLPLWGYLQTRQGQPTGIPFIDSLPIRVCHNRRIHAHRGFDGFAQRGRSSVDWFYGFQWHLVINDQGERLGLCLTSGHVDDRRPVAQWVPQLWGKRFGDRGHLSQRLFDELWAQGLPLITKLKKKMKNKRMPMVDKLWLRKRSLIECVNDQRKNISQMEHTRHRRVVHGWVNLIAAVVAYTFQPKKPALDWDTVDLQPQQQQLLAAAIL